MANELLVRSGVVKGKEKPKPKEPKAKPTQEK